MNCKTKYIFSIAILCIVLGIIGIVFFEKINFVVDENTVTRYEWLQMLGERFGINEYTNELPYFKDVDSDNPYFAYVQSAVEWQVIDADSAFDGEDYASGQFIALTSIKTIGESKFKICFDTEDAITDDVYIESAVEHGLVEEEKLKKGFSKEECEQVLENLQNLYFGEFWKDDYSNITYQNGVIELSTEDVLQSNVDCSEIVVTDNMIDSFKVGNIIVFEQENTKLKFAREITGISSDGTLSLSTVELDKVVETFTVSDITELTFEDIVNYYGLKENISAVNNLRYHQTDAGMVNIAVFSADVNSKGFKLSLSTEEEGEKRHLEVKITDNATGISYALPVSDKVETDSEYSAEIDIDKLCIGGQVSYSAWNGLEYAEAAVDAHATFNGAINAKKDRKIPLCKTPVPLGNGIVRADIQIYIVLSVEGGISFEAELPVEVSVSYKKDKGLRNFEHNITVEEPTIEANCDAKAMLRLEPTFVVLGCLNVMDTEADIGVSASAEIVTRPNSQICADVSVSFPVMTLSVCGDDDADTIIGNVGLSAEWEIISSDDAPIQKGFHYELLPDKTVQFVDECTYGEQEETSSESVQQDTSLPNGITEFPRFGTYELPIDLWITAPFEDSGDYYTVKGNLRINYSILYMDFDKLQKGDSFTILDKEFILGERLEIEEFLGRLYSVYCVNDDCTYYIQTKISTNFGSRFALPYYSICRSIPDYDTIYESMEYLSDDLGVHEFRIPKDAYITSLVEIAGNEYMSMAFEATGLSEEEIFALKEEQRKEDLARFAHTAEECFENHVLFDDWIDITNFSSVYGEMDFPIECYAIFDENGVIDTIILADIG